MSPEEQKVVDALKAAFVEAIGGLGGTVGKGEVIMPADTVWLRYARAAITAIKE